MKIRIFIQLIAFTLILLNIIFCCGVKAEFNDDSWMNPSSWSENLECCKCPESSVASTAGNGKSDGTDDTKFTEDGVALLYMRRWLIQLFDRKKLIHDDKCKIYKRSLSFTLSSSHLQKIEKLNDPRDLDEIITEIFSTAKTVSDGQVETGFTALVVDIFIDLLQLTKINEMRFLLGSIVVALCAWYIHRRYKISYLSQVALALFVFGYIHTYLECNRELEINEMKEVLKLSDQTRPSKFYSFLSSFFSSSNSHDEHHQQLLKKSTKIKLGFCRPDHVAIMYFNDMFMKYAEVMIKQSLGTLGMLQENLIWPLNWIAGIMLFGLIAFLIKLTFQYILGPGIWSYRMHSINQNPNVAAIHPHTDRVPIHPHTDRVSGDNLKKLLTVLSASVEGNKMQKLPVASGVEEIQEAIQCAPDNDTSTSSTHSKDSSKIKNNNESPAKETNTNLSDVKMEDLTEDT